MSTSGTFVFASPQSEQIILDAYERVGIDYPKLTAERIIAAQRSINFILQSWANRTLNLWTVAQNMLALVPNQTAYTLPADTIDILEATVRTSNRNLGGVAASSSGMAANAFDSNPATACSQTSPDGYINYNWLNGTMITVSMVGVQSFTQESYTLSFQVSSDGVHWTTVLSLPIQSYPAQSIQWFVVPVPLPFAWFQVIETGGATLNIAELYFNSNVYDTLVNRMSRAEYIATPNKGTPTVARPSSFYVDRQIQPVLYVYPTPSLYFNNFFYTYKQQNQDIGSMVNTAQVPARFLEALCAKLAQMLGIKEKIETDRIAYLGDLAKLEFDLAKEEDRERVPLRIFGDYMQGWTSI